jgi:zinc protease
VILLTWAAGLAAAAEPFATTATVHTLDNGLVVILEEDHRTDLVALHLRYGVGSGDEAAREFGCAHLFEHLMFEGSQNVGPNKFDEWLTAAGGENNAWTSEDTTAYHMTYSSGASPLALFLESDRMGWLLAGVTAENLANQQLVVLQERAEGYAMPNGRDYDALTRLVWPEGHPYHHPVIGTVADVKGFQVDQVHGFWKLHYRPRNAVLAIVGNFETEAMLEQVKAWFGEVPDPGPAAARPPAVDLVPRRADGMLEDAVQSRTLYLAWPTVPDGHADQPALDLLFQVLSGGRGTRLDDRLYYDSRIASSVGAWSEPRRISGMGVVYVEAPKTPLPKVAAVVEGTIAKIQAEPPTAAELDRARKGMRSWWLDSFEVPEDRASELANCQVTRGRPDCLPAEWARYEAVTPQDLSRVARTYLVPERRISLSVVPKGDDGALPGAQLVEVP